MPSKRWDQFDEQDAQDTKKWLANGGKLLTRAQLMRRQHAAFVRLVKKLHDRVDRTTPHSNEGADEQLGYMNACRQILAALQQGGKK